VLPLCLLPQVPRALASSLDGAPGRPWACRRVVWCGVCVLPPMLRARTPAPPCPSTFLFRAPPTTARPPGGALGGTAGSARGQVAVHGHDSFSSSPVGSEHNSHRSISGWLGQDVDDKNYPALTQDNFLCSFYRPIEGGLIDCTCTRLINKISPTITPIDPTAAMLANPVTKGRFGEQLIVILQLAAHEIRRSPIDSARAVFRCVLAGNE
jgi:hypothetical protein